MTFDYPPSTAFENYIIGWDERRKVIEDVFSSYDKENQTIIIYLHFIVTASDFMHQSYYNILKFNLFYHLGSHIFNTLYPKKEISGINERDLIRIERLVSMMTVYHCFKKDIYHEPLLEFFREFLGILEDDYQRCKCFIQRPGNKNIDLPLGNVIDLIREVKNGETIHDMDDMMNFFNDYIDQRFTKRPETVTPYMPFLSENQKKKWWQLSPECGFFPDY